LILVGDHQSATNEGHYELTSAYLELAKETACKGFTHLAATVSTACRETCGLGAVNNLALVEEMNDTAWFSKRTSQEGHRRSFWIVAGLGALWH